MCHVGVDICNLGGFENLGICTMWVFLKICNLGEFGEFGYMYHIVGVLDFCKSGGFGN